MEDPSFSSDRVREAHCRVNVTCGDKTGCFVGGHWDRKHKQQSDVWVVCFCCQQRLLCRDFECHAGRQAARSWQTSTKVADQSCANLGEWIRRECHKIGNRAVGQRISVWLPSKRLTQLGTVTQYNDEDKEHTILYCDGTEERLYLAVEAYKLEGDAKGPRRQERRTGAVVEEDASSVSAPRKRSSGLRNAQQAQAANTYTAASALLGMSHSQSKRQQTLNSHFLSQAAPTDTATSSPGVCQINVHEWRAIFLEQGLLDVDQKHANVRQLLLSLMTVDNRLLPAYLGRCWAPANKEPHEFIDTLFTHFKRRVTSPMASMLDMQVQASLVQMFRGALGLA